MIPSLKKEMAIVSLVSLEKADNVEGEVLTLICANTLECARTRVDRRRDLHQRAPCTQTGQTGYGDRSDRFYRERREDLKPRAREGPRRSSWI